MYEMNIMNLLMQSKHFGANRSKFLVQGWNKRSHEEYFIHLFTNIIENIQFLRIVYLALDWHWGSSQTQREARPLVYWKLQSNGGRVWQCNGREDENESLIALQ